MAGAAGLRARVVSGSGRLELHVVSSVRGRLLRRRGRIVVAIPFVGGGIASRRIVLAAAGLEVAAQTHCCGCVGGAVSGLGSVGLDP